MTYLVACKCQGFASQGYSLAGFARKLRRAAHGVALGLVLLAGSALVVTSWMPRALPPVAESSIDLYLQEPGQASVRQDLSDSISPSTVLGTSIR